MAKIMLETNQARTLPTARNTVNLKRGRLLLVLGSCLTRRQHHLPSAAEYALADEGPASGGEAVVVKRVFVQ